MPVNPRRRMPRRAVRQAGAGLIEVLVALLLLSVAVLGAAGMYLRSIEYTVDAERRQAASTVASELMETMRGDAATVLLANGEPKTDLGGYLKPRGMLVEPGTDGDCQPLPSAPGKRLGCWGARAKKLIPDLDDALIKDRFAVDLDPASGAISITVAWTVPNGRCLKDEAHADDDAHCTFTLRSRV